MKTKQKKETLIELYTLTPNNNNNKKQVHVKTGEMPV